MTDKMKIALFLVSILFIPAFFFIVREQTSPLPTLKEARVAYYTCPMHPHIHAEAPGNCPICGMTLVPVFSEEKGDEAGVLIPAEAALLIGLQSAPARKAGTETSPGPSRDQANPELTLALREHIEAARSAPDLQGAAASRLRNIEGGREKEAGRALLLIPSSAIVRTGSKTYVYVAAGKGRFIARDIRVGREEGTESAVEDGLKEGELVVSEGVFFVDAEARLKKGAL